MSTLTPQRESDLTTDAPTPNRVSRRDVIAAPAAIAGVSGVLLANAGQVHARPASKPGTGAHVAGRKFKAWVTAGNSGSLEELILRPLNDRGVLVRNEAAPCCYSNASWLLGHPPEIPGLPFLTQKPVILGHGSVGIVEAIGDKVKRVQVGDRVLIGVTPECGQCYQCLHDRADFCQVLIDPQYEVAEMADHTPVMMSTNIGGHGELSVTTEEWCVPIASDLPATQLAMLCCSGTTGLGAATVSAPIWQGASVVVLGAGPVGLSAIQGARISGAGQIIAVEPIAYRRDLAMQLGATAVLDPVPEGDKLYERLMSLCAGPTTRTFAGGTKAGPPGITGAGPDFVIEAVGGSALLPKNQPVPDPTGIKTLELAYNLCPMGGHVTTLGVIYAGNVSFPANPWSISGRTHHSSNYGGSHLMRDVPRFIKLVERGLFDAKALATSTWTLGKTREAFQAVIDRSTVAALLTFN